MDKVKKIFKCDLVYYFLILISILFLFLQDFRKSSISFNDFSKTKLLVFLIISAITIIITFGLMIFIKKSKLFEKKLWIIYIVSAILIGLIYSVVVPLFAQSDEPVHFFRAYEVSEGYIVSPVNDNQISNYFPKSFQTILYSGINSKREYKRYADIPFMLNTSLEKQDTELVSGYTNYNFLCYLPAAIGMKIGSVLNLSPYLIGILGRITSLIICAIIIGLGIRKLPEKKMYAFLIFLSPVVLSYFASISADGVVISSSFLFISYILYYIKEKKLINNIDKVIMLILSICLLLCKTAYFPILLLLFLLPKECFNNKKKYMYIILDLIIVFLSYIIMSKIVPYVSTASTDVDTVNNVIKWIFKNPISYAFILLRTTLNNCYDLISNMFAGDFLCHHQITVYSFIPICYVIIVIISYFNEKNNNIKSKMKPLLLSLMIIFLIYGVIATAMYAYNTAPSMGTGYPLIIGIQGRYLIPLLPLLLFIKNDKHFNVNEKQLINIALVLNVMIILTMAVTFSF